MTIKYKVLNAWRKNRVGRKTVLVHTVEYETDGYEPIDYFDSNFKDAMLVGEVEISGDAAQYLDCIYHGEE